MRDLLLKTTIVIAIAAPLRAAESLVEGFEVETYAGGLVEPVAMEFATPEMLFVAERGGTVRVLENGVLSPTIFATEEVFVPNENGLLGLALSPTFAEDGHIFVFATKSPGEQQILRYTAMLSDDPNHPGWIGAERTIIRQNLPTRGEFHSGGGLKVGPDGKLYFSIGDNLIQENGQNMQTLAGKISRINLDGSTPSDNPFTTATGAPSSIYALGFRNVFRFCFAPDGRIFALDVGSDGDGRREEINIVRAGLNYGWPEVEGQQGLFRDDRFTDPIYDYHDGGAAPVGAVYYTGDQFPEEYVGDLFHLEYVLNRLYHVNMSGDRALSHDVFVQGESGPIDLTQGPDGALYYCELHSGQIKRVSYRQAAVAGEMVDVAASPDESGESDAPISPNAGCGFGAIFGMMGVLIGLSSRKATASAF